MVQGGINLFKKELENLKEFKIQKQAEDKKAKKAEKKIRQKEKNKDLECFNTVEELDEKKDYVPNIAVSNPFACLDPISSFEDKQEEVTDNIFKGKATVQLEDAENNIEAASRETDQSYQSYTPTTSPPRRQSSPYDPCDQPLPPEKSGTTITPGTNARCL